MTTINRRTHDGPTTNLDRSPAGNAAGRPSAQLILDGVIAGYIHDISGRHARRQISREATAPSQRASLYR